MKCSWLTPLLLVAVAGAIPAQEPLITPEMPVDDNTLHQWLHSSDPRLIAWAADFARRKHDAKIVAEMPALLEHWTMPPLDGGDESQRAERRAAQAVLDTLIRENAVPPIPAIEAVAPIFPTQASILIARLPLSESRVTLGDWSLGSTGASWTGPALARIATMMLAKDPGPSLGIRNGNLAGFVANVVAASEEQLQISVSSSNTRHSLIGSNSCGDSIGHKATPGWPQVYAYGLEEDNYQKVREPIVVDLDGDQIFYRRYEENGGWGSCNAVQSLNPTTRHRIIAHWLGIPERDMTWQPVESFAIVWTDKASFQRQLGEIVEAQREKLYATVESLRQRGFLRDGETANLSPRLLVTVQCDIDPCPLR
ncbi:MAG: hypothetical protein ABR905_18790 [Terracidiphilus sp.]